MSDFGPIPPAPEEQAQTPAVPSPEPPRVQPEAASAAQGPSAAPPRKKSRKGLFFLGAFGGCLLLVIGFAFLAMVFAATQGESTDLSISSNKIAVVPIEGEIVESRETIERIHKYAENPMVKAIVIRVNSPGGAIAPSQEIYSEIRKVRKKSGKPFIASLDSVAASGGYYIAVACDEIVANPGSITGSIGVILQWLDMQELAKWAKLKPEMITSGALKGTGSPLKTLTDEERAYLQRIVSQLHLQFVKAVVAGRNGKVTQDEVARVADGRIFTGEEAVALKLVDRLGNLEDAIDVAADAAGIEGEPATLYPRKRGSTLLELLTDTSDADALLQRLVSARAARFLYLW